MSTTEENSNQLDESISDDEEELLGPKDDTDDVMHIPPPLTNGWKFATMGTIKTHPRT